MMKCLSMLSYWLPCLLSVASVALLVFSNGQDLLIGDIHGHSSRTLVHSQNRGVPVGVDFHYLLNRVFWTDTIQNKVILALKYFTWVVPVALLRHQCIVRITCTVDRSYSPQDRKAYCLRKCLSCTGTCTTPPKEREYFVRSVKIPPLLILYKW